MKLICSLLFLYFSLFILSSCTNENEADLKVSNRIENILKNRLGVNLRNDLRINADSSYAEYSGKKVTFSKIKDLSKLNNVPVSLYLELPSKSTTKKYHIFTLALDKNAKIIKFETFLIELKSVVAKDETTFYSPRLLRTQFEKKYGKSATYLKSSNNDWEILFQDNDNDKRLIISISKFYRRDTMPNGMIWSDGYFLSYDLLNKTFLDEGTISSSGPASETN